MTTSSFGLPPGATEGDEVIYITGPVGPTGPTGAGVKEGGTVGQILSKASSTNFDTIWVDPNTSTIPTTTQTSISSQGGLLVNIDSATGDIARTTNGWIENERFGWYMNRAATSVSVEFDSAVTRTGRLTLKITTDASGRAKAFMYDVTGASGWNQKYLVPVKSSTKYKLSCWVKTNNVATNSAFLLVEQFNTSLGVVTSANTTALTGTNDWTLINYEVTTSATTVYMSFNPHLNVAGNISDAWFDINSMTLEEILEPVTNYIPYSSSSNSLTSFTAVGSIDNVDQSIDPTFIAVNTYIPPVAISETATNLQTFIPTKSKVTRIGIYPVSKGTGNWTVTIHDASNVVQASITIANASLTNGAVNYFNVPCNLTALSSYHFHVTSTVADGTVRVGTASDLETVSYIQNYYKPTTNFKASQNNLSVSISADEDGFLNGSVINLVNGTYSYTPTADVGTSFIPSLFSYTSPSGDTANTFLISGTDQQIKSSISGTHICTFKANIPNAVSITISGTVRRSSAEWSYDNSSWTMINDNIGTSIFIPFTTTIPASGSDIFVRFTSASGSLGSYIGAITDPFRITASIDVSSYSVLKNYPTNKNVIKQYSTNLGSATTSATYRATKWGFPSIEYSATEYQFLDIDTTASGSSVTFSESGAIYTTVTDGGSITITSTTTPSIFVKSNITANRIYLSSNDLNASNDKDGSLKQAVVYQVIQ